LGLSSYTQWLSFKKLGFETGPQLVTIYYPTKQFALNRWLVDRKDQSKRYNFEDLFDILYHTCRRGKDSPQNKIFKRSLVKDST
jgi:hypothetical protein